MCLSQGDSSADHSLATLFLLQLAQMSCHVDGGATDDAVVVVGVTQPTPLSLPLSLCHRCRFVL